MPETFFIADCHFNHKGIINFESTKPYRNFESINEHDEELIKRWNSVVGLKDNVWILGDFAFGKKNIKIAERLNGYKKLVMGNHDCYDAREYLKYFANVYGAVSYKHGCLLTHVPVHPSQLERYKYNIHGHLHTYKIDDPRYINVSAEQINLTPISFEDIMNMAANNALGI